MAHTQQAGRGRLTRLAASALIIAGLACRPTPSSRETPAAFPAPDRRVAEIISSGWDSERRRDEAGEADRVMDLLGVREGMHVADIGAGSGYYAVRLSKRVGPMGTVYAEDIVPAYLDSLRIRVAAEQLVNVTPVSGTSADPKLPAGRIDVMILSHMYHEIENPYEFLWHAQPAFRAGGRIGIIDLDRETWQHGTPIPLLTCELERLGYVREGIYYLAPASGYLAIFKAPATRPDPATLTACVA